MLAAVLLAYIATAVVFYRWCMLTAQPMPHPDWIWDENIDEQADVARRAA
jgi:hypothetical protein